MSIFIQTLLNESTPMFTVSWLLTWFSHTMYEIEKVLRVFDFLLSSPSYSIIYMCTAVIIASKSDLFKDGSEPDVIRLRKFFIYLAGNCSHFLSEK